MSPEKFLSEANAMKQLSHAKVVSLLAIVSKGEPFMIVTELMENGDLKKLLKKDSGSIQENDLRGISHQVC